MPSLCHICRLLSPLLLLAAALLQLPAAAAAGMSMTIEQHQLANGLRVIVKEDHRAPVVVSMVWYRVGSIDEENGTTGISHALEHMMFKGTRQVPAGEFSRLVAAAGGRENAFTDRDYTSFHQQLQKSRLPLAFRLEADRMQNLTLSPQEYAKEIRVVMEERRMRTDDQPEARVQESLMATAFTSSPYRVPVIGWMNDIQNMTVGDVRDWYRRWYAPNNAIIVVVGDVKAPEVFALAEKYFGAIKPKLLPERKPQEEPSQEGIRRVVVKAPAELPYLMMAWRTPWLHDLDKEWEPYALDVLSEILDGNEAARLNSTLVRNERIATSIGVSYDDTLRGPALFIVSGTPASGKTVADLEQGIRREIARIAADGISDEELKRVKAQLVASQVYQRDSMFFQALQIGSLASDGYPADGVDLILQKLRQVTAAQVQQVANKYFNDDGLTVATLDPQPLNGRRLAPPMEMDHVR
ncbi:MAG TPA: pitrilysin family protein [Burkholderiales bacterium]|nr:pitrilysin family protein [Burkholderiales bacterium]